MPRFHEQAGVELFAGVSLNARYQFVLLYTVGWERLEDARAAHEAVENGVVGKVLVTVDADA